MEAYELQNADVAVQIYERRYADGYMDEWPAEKKRRISALIKDLPLPEKGRALDFGCGNGIFTNVIKEALPGWEVYGCDISSVAIGNALQRYPQCKFFLSGALGMESLNFDFIFSHHVFEHVHNLENTIKEMDALARPQCCMLHVLPCGNPGSLAHTISKLRKDGINSDKGDRYFFEDPGHLRRIKTDQLENLFRVHEYHLHGEKYSNQLHGEIEYMTSLSREFILSLTDEAQAMDENSARELRRIREKLLLIYNLRYFAMFVRDRIGKNNKTLRQYMALACGLCFWGISYPFDLYFRSRARLEWKDSSNQRNGGEMYLSFLRVV
jgi:SAM-dependent methyltransferase